MRDQALYDHPELYDRLVPPGPCERFYDSVAPQTAALLDLACGTGRLTIPLAKGSRRVTGLDASPSMLAAARLKASAAQVSIDWRLGDMANFDLGRDFDVITLTCNSLAHLTDHDGLQGCFEAVRRHLTEEGVFAFDIVRPDPKRLTRPEQARVRRTPPGSGVRVRETGRYDAARRVSRDIWRIIDSDGSLREVDFELRRFEDDEMPDLLAAAGLHLMERYGDFERSRFSSRSRLQVCLARRA